MFEGFQFPKTILTWIETHPGTAGWVQAIGAITIILATVHIAGADRRDRQRKERLEREGIALVLLTELIAFRGVLERAKDGGLVADAIIDTPPTLWRLAHLMQMILLPQNLVARSARGRSLTKRLGLTSRARSRSI
jgi:hypothetical protein